MIHKDLLIVYNIFGATEYEMYDKHLKTIISNLKKYNTENTIRLVVSACLKSIECLNKIKENFGDYLTIILYDERLPVQVTFNKTVLTSIEMFQEDYEAYLYMSGDSHFLDDTKDILPRLIEKNKTGEYGIIHLETDDDYMGFFGTFDFLARSNHDRKIPLGNWNNFIVGSLHKSLKEFYGVPMPDVHGVCQMEPTLSYACSALRKKYIVMGNSLLGHFVGSDSTVPRLNSRGQEYKDRGVNCGLMWGRTFAKDILSDIEAINAGLGYYPYNNNELQPENWIPHDKSKFDENELSIDENLKFGVKRCFYTNKNEIDYDTIIYEII